MCLTICFKSNPGGVLFLKLQCCALCDCQEHCGFGHFSSSRVPLCLGGLCREFGKESTELLYFPHCPHPLWFPCASGLTLLFFSGVMSEEALLLHLPSFDLSSEGLAEAERPTDSASYSTQKLLSFILSGQLGTKCFVIIHLLKKKYRIKSFQGLCHSLEWSNTSHVQCFHQTSRGRAPTFFPEVGLALSLPDDSD